MSNSSIFSYRDNQIINLLTAIKLNICLLDSLCSCDAVLYHLIIWTFFHTDSFSCMQYNIVFEMAKIVLRLIDKESKKNTSYIFSISTSV